MTRLRAESDLSGNFEERPVTRSELLAGVVGKQGLLCLVTDTIDSAVLEAGSELRVIANMAVGYNNIDVEGARARDVLVTNTPGVLVDTTADLTWALLLATARRVTEADRWARSGDWPGWGPSQLLGTDVSGATLGIVGLGEIGCATARRAGGFSMKVLYWNRTRREPEEETALGVEYRELNDLLAESDFVSLHVAYNQDTHHLIGRPELELLGPEGFLINTARGPVVDEQALIDCLEDETIAGAGLDVFEHEPAIPDRLRQLDNAVLLPHIGSASRATRARMATMAVDNVLAGCRGEEPPNRV
jgi:glyoxylate reductase